MPRQERQPAAGRAAGGRGIWGNLVVGEAIGDSLGQPVPGHGPAAASSIATSMAADGRCPGGCRHAVTTGSSPAGQPDRSGASVPGRSPPAGQSPKGMRPVAAKKARQPNARMSSSVSSVAARAADGRPAGADVGEHWAVRPEHGVGGPQGPVGESRRVDVREAAGHAGRQPQRRLGGQRPGLGDHRVQRRAWNQERRDPGGGRVGIGVHEHRGARPPDRGGCPDPRRQPAARFPLSRRTRRA